MTMTIGYETRPDTAADAVERLFTKAVPLPPPAVTYTISARSKSSDAPVFGYLRRQYGNVPLREIDSLFGFVERSELYGGRAYRRRELSETDVEQLNGAGIGVRLPLSNHDVERDEYERNLPLLEKYHRQGNFVIVTNDDLARWIRQDFPGYQIDASVIKNIKTHRKINEALELYNSVVLPMRINEDLEFLEKIEAKDRITLFANAGCALTCPSKLCYPSFSKFNKGKGGEIKCSQSLKERDTFGMVDFPLQPFIDLGFHRFKLLRARPDSMTGF
ncbi:MAG: hypothetical protein BMS9Abin32_729 [Gammaproteobacteria bacterium]|nr:MAG: hypothetical protein BMS9Abin32_729 [Gammaproteobacteria bacterium]